MTKDPVCGKDVQAEKINEGDPLAGAPVSDPSYGTKHFHDGNWYYFCSMACRQRFIANPGRYLETEEPA